MSVAAAVCVVLMMGTSRLQRAIFFYGLSTFLVAIVSISHFFCSRQESHYFCYFPPGDGQGCAHPYLSAMA